MESDHSPIITTINLKHEKNPLNTTHKLYHKFVDWKLYNSHIEEYISENTQTINNYNPEEKYNILINLCILTVKKLNKKPKKPSSLNPSDTSFNHPSQLIINTQMEIKENFTNQPSVKSSMVERYMFRPCQGEKNCCKQPSKKSLI